MKCIFSVDVEDWFHILDVPSTPKIGQWDSLPSRVERNFLKLLDIFDEYSVSVTCFFLGWVGAKYPGLVKEADKRGHEIASHGYSHELTYRMSSTAFLDDVVKAKKLLEDISGETVIGYRASGFSYTKDSPWFFDRLIETGHKYDSSVFPASHGHGGIEVPSYSPHLIKKNGGTIIEFPISISKVFGRPICFFGGGYLRFFPFQIIKKMANNVHKKKRPVIFYLHPREIDPFQPRLQMNAIRKFKSYCNLSTTENKVKRILASFEFETMKKFIESNFTQES